MAKKIIDEWQPKRHETRPKFILYSLILKYYATLDKLVGEILKPTYAEMWLAKRGDAEPNDWLAAYRTWQDQMELALIDRQTYEN